MQINLVQSRLIRINLNYKNIKNPSIEMTSHSNEDFIKSAIL